MTPAGPRHGGDEVFDHEAQQRGDDGPVFDQHHEQGFDEHGYEHGYEHQVDAHHYDEHDAEHGYDEHDYEPDYDAEADHLGYQAETRRARRARRARERNRGVRRFVVLFVALGLVAAAGYLGYAALRPMFSGTVEATDYPGPGGEPVLFTVADGDSGRAIASKLEKAGVVKTAQAFVDAVNADSRAGGIQPGDYPLKTQMRAVDALAVLVDPKNRQSQKVVIREGLWASEVYAALSKATGAPVAAYEAAAKDTAAIGLPADANGNVEGYLFPATYEFTAKDSPTTQLRAMISKTRVQLTKLGQDPENSQRTLIVASIIEAEARRDEDRAKVSRVVANRLAKPMRLQLDSTVSYGAKKRAITTTDAERADPNPWNTYARDGLPAGPIGNPGLSAIEAALAPADGPWLFFVAVNPETGETKFAVTATEHDALVAEFQGWCNRPENKGKCSR